MKRLLIILFSIVGLLVLAIILIPFFFKDEIKAKIDEELNKTLNATVVFDTDNFHLSLIRNFPNVTIVLEEFGIINKEPFSGEILFAVERLDIEVNLKKVLIDKELSVEGIYLNRPIINLLGDDEGNVNWDIYIPSEDTITEEEVTEEGEVNFGIEEWRITDGDFVFSDAASGFTMELIGMDHSGSGDFTLTVFDMDTETEIDAVRIVFDGVHYLKNQSLELDAVLTMDLDQMKFTFKENEARINDFAMGFDGWFAMPEGGYDMDISFAARDNSFKSLLSLIPAVYMEGFEDLKSSGSLSFNGYVRGSYTEDQMPGYAVNLQVADGMFQYPDLPAAVTNVAMDMGLLNEDGNTDNTRIDISKFHIEFGNNPIDATLSIANLRNYPVKGQLLGELNLGELSTMFPMEGMEMRGQLNIDIKMDGVYDSVKSIIPKLNAVFKLSNGYVKSEDVPAPLEDMVVDARITNKTGFFNDLRIDIPEFRMKFQDEEISATLALEDMSDYSWDASLAGTLDLAKLLPIINEFYEMPGVEMEGKIFSALRSKGKMSDLEAERYANLATSGELRVSDFRYVDAEMLPQGFGIQSSTMKFNSREVRLESFSGNIGKSDLRLSGSLENHLAYVFADETVVGNLIFNSSLIDLNEFMTDEEVGEEEETESMDLEVIPIPQNIDFTLTTNIDRIVYDNMTLENARGEIVIVHGEINMNDLRFNTLGGTIVMNGKYNTHDPSSPYFDYNLDIKSLSIRESFTTFNTVQRMAPIARNVTGDYSTSFKISGNLKENMMPDYPTLAGAGLIRVAQAALENSKIVAGINAITTQSNASNATLSDILMKGEIREGRFYVEPFDVKLGNYQTTVSGSNGLDGTLDYQLKMDIPAGALGQTVNQSIASITGSNLPASETIKLTIGVGGTYDDPKPQLLGANTGDGLKEAVAAEVKQELIKKIQKQTTADIPVTDIPQSTEEAKEEVKQVAQETKEEVRQEIDTTKAEVRDIAMTQADSLKKGLLSGDTATVEKAVKDAQDQIRDLFNRKKKKKNN